jgi:hypothetical protein
MKQLPTYLHYYLTICSRFLLEKLLIPHHLIRTEGDILSVLFEYEVLDEVQKPTNHKGKFCLLVSKAVSFFASRENQNGKWMKLKYYRNHLYVERTK